MLPSNHKTQYFALLILIKIILIPQGAVAQVLSTPNEKVIEAEIEELYLPPEAGRLKLDLPDDLEQYFQLDSLPEKIEIEQIKLIGNTVFSTAELRESIALEQKETISKDDLRLIIARINLAYRDRGYLTSGVWESPKLEPNGIIFIPITEGKIEDIKILGLTKLRESYIRKRLFRDRHQIFNQDRLKESLQLLQLNRLIDNISATVVPGSTIGNNILEVEVQEDDRFYLELSLDNLGNLSSGSFRRQLKINNDNLLGYGDRLFVGYTNTDGLNALDSLGYSLPINSKDGTIALSYGIGKAEFIQESFDSLDLDFEFQAVQVSLYQPVYQTPKQEFALGLALSYIDTQTTLDDQPFQIGRDGNQDGELNISAIDFSQNYIRRGKRDRFDLRSQLSLGVNFLGATQNGDNPDSNFFIWRGQTSYLRQLASNLNLSLKSYWQLSDRPLVYLEQNPRKLFTFEREEERFILRGYRENALADDNGLYASAELQANILKIDSLNAVFQLTPFIDFGTAWSNSDLEIDESTLISAGLGLRLLVSDSFRARVDWGIPLIEQDLDSGSLQEDGITFNIEYRPF